MNLSSAINDAGLLAFIPPVLSIILAIVTKDVAISLFMGILSGSFIWAGGMPLLALTHVADLAAAKVGDAWNVRIFLFCALLGAIIGLLSRAGAAEAFGHAAGRHIKGRKSAQIYTWIFGLVVFIDDYFNTMAVGSVMRPITDKNRVSRAKLAYLLDSTAAPVCIIVPISSWVVTVISQIRGSDGFKDVGMGEMSFFMHTILYNFYAILAIALCFIVAITDRDFGAMADSEARAKKGILSNPEKYGPAAEPLKPHEMASGARWFDMIIPMLALILACVFAFPYTGRTALGHAAPIVDYFRNADAGKALLGGVIFALIFTYAYFIARRMLNIKMAGEAVVDGVKTMVPALLTLSLAWIIGHIISKPLSDGGLGLPLALDRVLRAGSFPLWALPICLYVLSAIVSFATGTSWGTFGIMIPIAIPLAVGLAHEHNLVGPAFANATLISVGAVLSGGVFGDHASPISDTTILSSAGAGCPHLEHVATQMFYATFAAICAGVGIVVAGFALNWWLPMVASVATFSIGFMLLTLRHKKRESNAT